MGGKCIGEPVVLEPSGDGVMEGVEILVFGGEESAVHVGLQKPSEVW